MITRVRARNFRSLKEVDFSLGPLNVLVGPNMGGKSNVLDLFRFLYECWFPQPSTFGPLSAVARRQGMEELLWKGGADNLLAIGLEFQAPGQPSKKFDYELELLGGTGGYLTIQKEALTLAEDGSNHQLITKDGEGRWLANADGSKLGLFQYERSALELAPLNWDGYPLKSFAQNWRFHQFIPELMKQVNQMTSGGILDVHGSNLSAWLMWLQTRAPQAFARIAEVAGDVFPEVRGLLTWPMNQGTVYLASQEKALLRPTPLFQMSDGELAFIAYLSLIFAPRELGGTLFLIEEPENHLHPRLFETLVALLRQAQQETGADGVEKSQIIATTHSPQVLDQMKLDEILWVAKTEGMTKVFKPWDKHSLRSLAVDEELGLGDLMFTGALGEE
ncbi:MAG TPA: AAA family ATPase [Bryobacteraceae bacterium]|nr:AAA family ATPase [Bryobacteraceae bacterium]